MRKSYRSRNDVCINSALSVVRNLSGYNFPSKLNINEVRELVEDISKIFLANEKYKFKKFNLWEESIEDIQLWIEYKAVTLKLYNNREFSAFLVDEKSRVVIMINEENHLTIIVRSAMAEALKILEELEELVFLASEELEFAYSDKFGYLTANLDKVGNGFSISHVVHLPAIARLDFLDFIRKDLEKVGFSLKDIFSNEYSGVSNIFRITNKTTIGIEPEEIVSDMESIKNKIILKEKNSRETILSEDEVGFLDEVFRAKGILKNARKLSYGETLRLISLVRWAVELRIIDDISAEAISKVIVTSKYNHIKKLTGPKPSENDELIKRADLIREFFKDTK